jgi:Ca-activated chloride channel family protein
MLRFQRPELVYLFVFLLVLLGAYLVYLRWKQSVSRKMGDPSLIAQLTSGYSAARSYLKYILLFIAFGAGILAVMNPRKPEAGSVESRKGIDVAIALDVSRSMLATDLAPNRLERAKQFIRKLMEAMPNDRVALVFFAGKAYLQMPLTVDHGAAAMFVSSASTNSVPQQGTVIGEALDMGMNAFSLTDRRFKTIVLISDGEDHDEGAVSTARDLAEQGVMINTIGIGSPQGSTIPDPLSGGLKKDETGNNVISVLNEQTLREIAEETNGTYVRLEETDAAVSTVLNQLSNIERTAFEDMSLMNFRTYYMWLLAPMFLLMLIEIFIPERKKQVS